MWGDIWALQSSGAVHSGGDNLGVVRHVGRLLNGPRGSVPLELVNDGDLLVLIERMLYLGGLGTVCISKVQGHADEGMVLDGRRRVDHAIIEGFVVESILFFWIFTSSSLSFLGLL